MADQLNMRDSSAPPTYFQPFKNNVFRLDEGYSEETRSQTGSEMRAESRQGHVMDAEGGPSPLLLPEWIGNLNESERSGMSLGCRVGPVLWECCMAKSRQTSINTTHQIPPRG